MSLPFLLLSCLIPGFLSFILLPRALRFAGELLGHRLRRSTRARRELLLARVAKEQRAYDAEHKAACKEGEDEWEEVEASMVGSAANGAKAAEDWRGIVAFFHPFW